WLEAEGVGEGTIQYRLRDWLFSRQRYWGEPFPLVHLEDGSVRALSDNDLPVLLPELDEFKPTADGRPPLARAQDWVNTTDPVTGAPAKRETNTMPQWAGSCWYYLRFISPHRNDVAWDAEEENYWMPVDLYVGGAEHAVLHLLYARFWHHVLHDLGLVSTREPFQRLFNQGMVHAMSYREIRSQDAHGNNVLGRYRYPHEVEERDGEWVVKETGARCVTQLEKMSKSRYNVENPDDIAREFGADALRLYELFMGPLDVGAHWETSGVQGTRRFLDRADRLVRGEASTVVPGTVANKAVDKALHGAIKKVSEAVESLRFNTAISEMMIFVNAASKAEKVGTEQLALFVRILAPFAPHLAEELWQVLGHADTITFAPWPKVDESKLVDDRITLIVQVNGKVRGKVEIDAGATKDDTLAAAKAEPAVAALIADKALKREIVIPGRLVNLVIG
ncbi:MAG: class I tRNA ligase family protein, partial [Myxococcota bacterium]